MKTLGWKGRAVLANQKGEEHGSVTPYQLTAIMVGAVIGVAVLAIPRIIAEPTGASAPLATLLGAVPVALAWLAFVWLQRRFPGRTPVEYAPALITKPLAWLYALLVVLFNIGITAFTLREFGDVVRSVVLPRTPVEVTVGSLLLITAWFVRYDVQVFARVFEVFFPLMLVPLTVIGLLSLKNARLMYLLPVVDTGWGGLMHGSALAMVGYVAYLIGPFLLPSLNRPKQAVKSGLWAIGLSAFVYMLAVTASLAVFGREEIKRLVWPTYDLIKTTTVPGFILERLESAFLGIWVAAVFTTVAASYYISLLAIAQTLRLRDHKVFVIPLVPVLYTIAMHPKNTQTLYQVVTVLGLFGLGLNMAMPLLFAGIALVRRKGIAPHANR